MSTQEAIILGLTQGITEFLPISSSGHLILIREFLEISTENTLSFDIFLNTATLFAVFFCFWKEILYLLRDFKTSGFNTRSKNLLSALIVGTVPAGIVGFIYGDKIENLFREPISVALALLAGSIFMFMSDRAKTEGGINIKKGFIIGLFQTLALIPGISRSGITISGGILSGLSREEAIKFSFLLLIPISFGALLKIFLDQDLNQIYSMLTPAGIISFFVALVSGILSVKFLVRYLSKNSFGPFIIYRIFLAIYILFFI